MAGTDPKTVGRRLAVHLDIQDDLPQILARPVEIERAVTHLLSNAVKFTADGGQVQLGVTTTDDAVLYRVTDTGVGIPLDEQPQLFDPFCAKHAHHQAAPGAGLGLGLGLVKDIVDSHTGTLTLHSAPGAGTTLTFSLPARQPSTPVTEA